MGCGSKSGSSSNTPTTTETPPPTSKYPDVEGIYNTLYAAASQRCDWYLTQEYINWCVRSCAPGQPIKTAGTRYDTLSAFSREVTVFQDDQNIWTGNDLAIFSAI